MSLLYLRHGKTAFNDSGPDGPPERFRAWANIPLTEDGLELARKAGEKLKNSGIAGIISSPLDRALHTAHAVSAATGVPVSVDHNLLPWHLGEFTGKSVAESIPQLQRYLKGPGIHEAVPGGESLADFLRRQAELLNRYGQQAQDKDLLLVAHHRNIQGAKFLGSGDKELVMDGPPAPGEVFPIPSTNVDVEAKLKALGQSSPDDKERQDMLRSLNS